MNVGKDIGSSLYTDDGAIWKRGKNIKHVTKSIQSAILKDGHMNGDLKCQ